MKILLLEDDIILNEIMEEFLVEHGMRVDTFFDGRLAFEACYSNKYDMLLLDINVPTMSGFELLKELQKAQIATPTIFISSLDQISDVKKGFALGAEDYLKKPFDLEELLVRIERTKKLHKIESTELIPLAKSITYNPRIYTINKEGINYTLRHKEAQLLEYFIKNQGKIISFDEIINHVWPYDETPTYATIRTYIKNIRPYLMEDQIQNIKGAGYVFKCL
ncbi:MAG: response regulator transcription factor [Sulfurospirillaceae bacterium]|nr:response regulator transcription factor [Sulfurospirillaceae bacterium]